MVDYDVIVIGEGPAGMSAAIYLKRANVNVMMLGKGAPGGKLIYTAEVENYPGFKKNSGYDLAQIMCEQVREFEIKRRVEEVKDVLREDDGTFTVITDKHKRTCNFVLFAGGTRVKVLGIPGEDKYMTKGISFCALCDGNLYDNEEVVVIGGGNSGFEEALYLAKICKKVTIISRSDHYRAAPILVRKAIDTPNMEIINNKELLEFVGDENHLSGVIIKDKINGVQETIPCKGAFIYIGFDPTSTMLAKFGVLDQKGYIYVDETRETNVPRLYAAGDCLHKSIRQVITAAADGVIAAMSIIRKI